MAHCSFHVTMRVCLCQQSGNVPKASDALVQARPGGCRKESDSERGQGMSDPAEQLYRSPVAPCGEVSVGGPGRR